MYKLIISALFLYISVDYKTYTDITIFLLFDWFSRFIDAAVRKKTVLLFKVLSWKNPENWTTNMWKHICSIGRTEFYLLYSYWLVQLKIKKKSLSIKRSILKTYVMTNHLKHGVSMTPCFWIALNIFGKLYVFVKIIIAVVNSESNEILCLTTRQCRAK